MTRWILIGVGAAAAVAAIALWLTAEKEGGEIAAVPATQEAAAPAPAVPAPAAAPGSEPQSAPQASPAAPSFDIVRIAPDGAGVIAGRAAPNAEVELLADGEVVARAQASESGEFSIVTSEPLQGGARTLTLAARDSEGVVTRSADPIIVMTPEASDSAPIVLKTDRVAPDLLQRPAVPSEIEVTLDSITYGEVGAVTLSGRGTPGRTVRVYLDGAFIGEAVTGPDGVWRLSLDDSVAPGDYTLRVDEIGASGRVVSRIESPFQRAAQDAIAVAAGQVVVQPGNSLWRIASRVYGEGLLYTQIYQANADQIRDPDLIYPGQIFTLPERAQ